MLPIGPNTLVFQLGHNPIAAVETLGSHTSTAAAGWVF